MGQREPLREDSVVEVASKVSGEGAGRRVQGSGAGRSGRVCGRPWSGESQFLYPSHSCRHTLAGPSRPLPPLSPVPRSVSREMTGVQENCFLPLLPVMAGQSGERGLPQPPIVRVRVATSGLMSQQAFSQILSLFSFLLHEMGIINEKQRGAGRNSGGTELLASQTCAPTPGWNPMYSWTEFLTNAYSAWGPALLSLLPSLKKESLGSPCPCAHSPFLGEESVILQWPRMGLGVPSRCSTSRFP